MLLQYLTSARDLKTLNNVSSRKHKHIFSFYQVSFTTLASKAISEWIKFYNFIWHAIKSALLQLTIQEYTVVSKHRFTVVSRQNKVKKAIVIIMTCKSFSIQTINPLLPISVCISILWREGVYISTNMHIFYSFNMQCLAGTHICDRGTQIFAELSQYICKETRYKTWKK